MHSSIARWATTCPGPSSPSTTTTAPRSRASNPRPRIDDALPNPLEVHRHGAHAVRVHSPQIRLDLNPRNRRGVIRRDTLRAETAPRPSSPSPRRVSEPLPRFSWLDLSNSPRYLARHARENLGDDFVGNRPETLGDVGNGDLVRALASRSGRPRRRSARPGRRSRQSYTCPCTPRPRWARAGREPAPAPSCAVTGESRRRSRPVGPRSASGAR